MLRNFQILLAILFVVGQLSAEIVSVKWPCVPSSRVNTSLVNSPSKGITTNGNLIVSNQASSNFYVRNYTGPVLDTEAIATFWPSTDGGTSYYSWANETGEVADRYIEFAVEPKTGYSFNFTSFSVQIGGIATGYLRANIYYSTDNFATRTSLNSNGLPILPQLASAADILVCSSVMNATVKAGEQLKIRVYPWFLRSSSSVKTIAISNVTLGGNDVADVLTVPTVSTYNVSQITSSTAKSGVNIVSNGGASIIQSGICWDSVPNPTINGQFGTLNGPGDGQFENELKYLEGNKTYYVRAYATNSVGPAYGEQKQFKTSSLLAFPGAEGFGKYTIGGRGGQVVEVTNLNDAGTGSLRYALETVKGPRTVVFRVSGTIDLQSPLSIKEPYITIAGQTAPGDGICIKRYPLYVQTDHVIIRYIRCRLGDEVVGDNDAISLMGCKNLMLDHCSFSWSIDCVADFTDGNGQCTMQWCIVSEALGSPNHTKGSHSMGGAWDGLFGGTYHHNLITNTNSRVPRIDAATGPDMFGKETRDLVDAYNNVTYNWGSGLAYGGEQADLNYRGNYIKQGPSTTKYTTTVFGPSAYCKIFVTGNYMTGSPSITANNVLGVSTDGTSWLDQLFQAQPFKVVEGKIEPATSAYTNVLSFSGAMLPKRDAVDTRIINEVITGQGKLITSQSEVGGWPVLNSTPAPLDSDHDGMPDSWETSNNLNPNDATDRNLLNSEGFTMLEVYLNSLCVSSFPEINTAIKENTVNSTGLYINTKNNNAQLNFNLRESASVVVKIYDTNARMIAVLNLENLSEGKHSKEFNYSKDLTGKIGFAKMEVYTSGLTPQTQSIKFIF